MAVLPQNVLRQDADKKESSLLNPSEEYLKIKRDIDQYPSTNDPLNMCPSSWSKDDKIEFAKWYNADRQKQREAFINAQRAKPAMKMAQYIAKLKNVDFLDTESIISFVGETQLRDWDPYPEPIVLGSELGHEGGVIYQLRSQLVDDEPMSDLGGGTVPSDAIVAIQPKKSATRYAFFLGVLEASLPPSKNSSGSRFSSSSIEPTTATRRLVHTPYRVCVFPLDRSIWLVLPESSLSVSTEDLSRGIPQDADTWAYLQTKANGRRPFDMIQVATWNDFITLTESTAVSRQLFSEKALETATRGFPELFVPAMTALKRAMPTRDISDSKKKDKEKEKGKPRQLLERVLSVAARTPSLKRHRVHEATGASEPRSEIITEREPGMSPLAVAEPSGSLVALVS